MNNNSQILIYQSPNGNICTDVLLEDDTVWLTQASMAELFQVKPQNITMHLKNIYDEVNCNWFQLVILSFIFLFFLHVFNYEIRKTSRKMTLE